MAVVNVDVVDVADFLEALNYHAIFALLAGDVVEPYVLDGRGEAAVAELFGLIDEVDFQH